MTSCRSFFSFTATQRILLGIVLAGAVALWASSALGGATAPPGTPTPTAAGTPTPGGGPTATPPLVTGTPPPPTPTPGATPTAGPTATAAPTPPATPTPSATLTKDQEKCVNKINKAGSKVDKAQLKENETCVKDFQKGKLIGTVEDCLTADAKGKVQKKEDKTVKDDTKFCVPLNPPPPFGYTGAQTVNDAAVAGPIALIHAIFGDPVDPALITSGANKDTATCQGQMLKDGNKLEDTVLKELVKGKKKALGEKDPTNSAELEDALRSILSSNKAITNKQNSLVKNVTNKCSNLLAPVGETFPGVCADGDLGNVQDCVIAAARCVACEKMNAFDDLNLNCDLADNSVEDGTCPIADAPATPTPAPATPTPGAPTPTPAPATPTPGGPTATPAPATPTPAGPTPTPLPPGVACDGGLCAGDPDLADSCDVFLAACIAAEPANEDECVGAALLICEGGPPGGVDPGNVCSQELCESDSALAQECQDFFDWCLAFEPGQNDEECLAGAFFICREGNL